jgi:hypothetical protein
MELAFSLHTIACLGASASAAAAAVRLSIVVLQPHMGKVHGEISGRTYIRLVTCIE